MKSYKGKVYFYKDLDSGRVGCIKAWDDGGFPLGNNYSELAVIDVDVTFKTDTREAQIESLEKQKESIDDEYQQASYSIDGKIAKLRAGEG